MASIYRRGRQWWGRTQVDNDDLRKPLKTTSEAIARQRLAQWLKEINRVGWGGKPLRLYDEAVLKFLEEHLPQLRPASRRRYLISIGALTPHFEGLALAEIGSAQLSAYETARRQAGVRIPERLAGRQKPRDISPATIRRDLACLSSIFGCCMEWEWVEFNPVPAYMKSRRRRGLKESPPGHRYLSHVEEAALLAQIRAEEVAAAARAPAASLLRQQLRDLYEAVCLAIDTGLRRNEEFALERAWLNHAKSQIELPGSITKNGLDRTVPLLPRSAQLSAHRPPHLGSPFLFTNPETKRRYIGLNRALRGAARRAGIAPLTWHDLRRTCGCRLLQDYRMTMEEVSRWLGHSSVLVTEKIYAFLEVEHLHRAIEAGTKAGT